MQHPPHRRTRWPRALAAAAATALSLVVLAACSGPSRQEAGRPAPVATPTTTVVTASDEGSDQGRGAGVEDGAAGTGGGAATTVTSAGGRQAAGGRLVLDPEGLGVARFGDAPDPVIAAVSRRLGKPRRDTGWRPIGEVYGVCPGTKTRAVTWGQFTALFTDGPTRHGPSGTEHFFLWSVEGERPTTPAATAAGIGVGATLAEVRRAYAGRVRTWEPDIPGTLPGFTVGPRDQPSFSGSLDGGRVRVLTGGTACGE
jgi:hypothetical protein